MSAVDLSRPATNWVTARALLHLLRSWMRAIMIEARECAAVIEARGASTDCVGVAAGEALGRKEVFGLTQVGYQCPLGLKAWPHHFTLSRRREHAC